MANDTSLLCTKFPIISITATVVVVSGNATSSGGQAGYLSASSVTRIVGTSLNMYAYHAIGTGASAPVYTSGSPGYTTFHYIGVSLGTLGAGGTVNLVRSVAVAGDWQGGVAPVAGDTINIPSGSDVNWPNGSLLAGCVINVSGMNYFSYITPQVNPAGNINVLSGGEHVSGNGSETNYAVLVSSGGKYTVNGAQDNSFVLVQAGGTYYFLTGECDGIVISEGGTVSLVGNGAIGGMFVFGPGTVATYTGSTSSPSGKFVVQSGATFLLSVTSAFNYGEIVVESNGVCTISGSGFSNSGVLNVETGGSMTISAASSSNVGVIAVQTGGSLTLNSGFTNFGPLILYAGSTFAGNGYTGSPPAIQLDVTNETTHYIGSLSDNITIINDSNTNPLYRLGGPSMTSLLPGNILQGNTIAGVSGNVYLPNNGNSPYTTDSTLVSSLGYFGIGNATRGMLESAPFEYGQPEDTMGAWSLSANLQGLLVPANYYRDKLVIQLQAGGPVYLGFGAAASAGSGVQLTTVGSVVIVTGPLAQMAVYGITQSGSTTTGGYQENLGVCD